jgi:hypothetical protein
LNEEVNPFELPKEDVYALRDREKQEKAERRARERNLKIWEKGPKKSNRIALIKSGTQTQKFASPKPDRMFQARRRDENMADFVEKKRHMFLIQMSLDTKRQEIKKLEEKAQMKELALKKSEMMLEEDAMRFDAFLKENDRKAHLALQKADAETKRKQKKVMDIKKLTQEINKVDNEMTKYEEQLENCKRYKKFLDSLTPKEHLDAVRERKEKAKKAKFEQLPMEEQQQTNWEEMSSDDDPDEMYFKRPEQLLKIFAQLEERNLFLIQNVQETEEALEELKQKMADTEQKMKEKTAQLDKNIGGLEEKIKIEKEKQKQYASRQQSHTSSGNQNLLLKALSEKVREVYSKCGFGDGGEQSFTLDMLRNIETKLESLLQDIRKLDAAKVREAEKKKEDLRRNDVRQKRKQEQKRQYEERLAKSTARAKAEVIRQTGKQVMFRSPPIKKKKKKEETVQKDEEADEKVKYKKFFTA